MPSRVPRRAATAGLLALALLAAAPVAEARFLRPDLEQVPLEALLANLEKIAAKEAKNAGVRVNLARAHAMAYALKTDSAQVWKGREKNGVWFGHTPAHVPFQVKKAADPAKAKEARAHLEQAIAWYEEALKVDGKNLTAALGLAWCLDQAGLRMKAVASYRQVIEEGWAKEGAMKFGPLGGNYVTAEAAGYLLPLLDKEKDGEEIAALKEKIARLKRLPRPITPIAVPLRDGLRAADLADPEARVRFDADGTALPRRWTWITPDAAWLVHDPKGTGRIDSALQLFGNVTFWMFWEDGYQALSVLDRDGDGWLTGAELTGLALWHDADGDGISGPGEVRPLLAYGIVALACRGIPDTNHPDRHLHAPVGVRFRDGSSRPTFDLLLRPAAERGAVRR